MGKDQDDLVQQLHQEAVRCHWEEEETSRLLLERSTERPWSATAWKRNDKRNLSTWHIGKP